MRITPNTANIPGASVGPDDELQVLLSDYSSLRDDERNTFAMQGVAVTIAIALLGGLVAFASQSCALTTDQKNCVAIPVVFLATAPSVPFAALGFVVLQGVVSVIRSYYIRLVELEIQARVPMHFKHLSKLGPASYIGLTTEILSLRRGRWSYRALTAIIVLVAVFTFSGITFYIAIHVDDATRSIMLLLYSIGILLVAYEIYIVTLRGRRLFLAVAGDYNEHRTEVLLLAKSKRLQQRGIFSYLLLPRLESLPKAIIAVVMFCVAASATGAWQWQRFLLLWIILEYFVYAARYQWNDLRDFDSDRLHPARDLRRRLPAGEDLRDTTNNIALSAIALLLRLSVAVFIGIETHTLGQVGLIIGAVFGIAICYEILRAQLLGRVSAAKVSATLPAVIIWLAVGPGYAVRGAVGLLAAHVRWTDPAFYIGLTGLMALGIMAVLMSWLLDASSFYSVAPDGTWHIKTTHSHAKVYSLILLRYASVPVESNKHRLPNPGKPGTETEGRQIKILKDRCVGWAPWNIAFAFASILICEFVTSLPGDRPVPATSYALTAVVSTIGAILIIYSDKQWKRWAATVGFVGFMLLASQATNSPHWLLAAIGWLAVAGSYTSFCDMSFLDLIQALPRLKDRLFNAGAAVIETVLGPTAFQYLRLQSRPAGSGAGIPGDKPGSAHSKSGSGANDGNIRGPASEKN